MARKPSARSSKKHASVTTDAVQVPEARIEQAALQIPDEIVPEPEQRTVPANRTKQSQSQKPSAKQVGSKHPKSSSSPEQEVPPVPSVKQAPATKQISLSQPGQILPLPQLLAQKHGFHHLGQIFHNLSTPELYEHILFLREGVMSAQGAVMVETTPNTKLAVRDKFIVEESVNKDNIAWGEANRAIDQAKFNAVKARVGAYLQRRNVYVQDCFVGSDVRLRVPFRILTENAWQSLFVRNIFTQALPTELRQFEPRMTIAVLPNFKAVPEIDGTRAETFVFYDFSQRLAIIGGTRHAEEIKKAVFTVMSYAMPLRGVLPMRCAATVGANGDTVLLFGTNGTGKTTLALDSARLLLGDDAHGWSDDGIFAFEQGSYAKAYNITPEADASIYGASRMFGTVLENVKFDTATRQPLYGDASITDNARIAYTNESVAHLQPLAPALRGAHAKTVIFLVNDALGVLPPVARLTQEQAIFFYLSGYAAKNPVGMDTKDGKSDAKFEPRVVFSAGFAETFMVQDPVQYAQLFRERLRRNNTTVWLVNTGWQGGTQATGSRVKREISRAIVSAITSGALDSAKFSTDAVFHLSIPAACPNVPSAMLNPQQSWKDKGAYEKHAQKLLSLLMENFKKYSGRMDKAVTQALQPAKTQAGQVETRQTDDMSVRKDSARKDSAAANNSIAERGVEQQEAQRSLKSVASVSTDAPLVEEFEGKKGKKTSKVTKKGRAKALIPDDDEADVGDTGQSSDNAPNDALHSEILSATDSLKAETDSGKEKYAKSPLTNPSEDDIVIPPSLFASEQGEYRPDNEEMPISSVFDDDDGETDEDGHTLEATGEDVAGMSVQGQSQYRGRRRRGGRGRRRSR